MGNKQNTSFYNFMFSESTALELLVKHKFLPDKWRRKIPKVSVFDIETLEFDRNDTSFEHRLVSIAMSSEIDNNTKYWVIEESTECARQKIGT